MSLPSIAWVGPMVSPALITAGSLRGKVALSGTLAEPHFGGQIAGQKLRVYLVGSGIDLQQGVLEGDFTDDTLQIRQLHFSGGDGEIAATGSVTLKAGKVGARLQMRATRFTVLDRVDRKLTLSGNTMLAIVEGRARLDGELKVDAGLVDVGRLGEPQLSDDVVILGREAQQRKALAADIDVTVDFGENLLLRGQGLKGRIGGDLHITSVAGGPLQARGLLKVVRGTYTAYGRELAIERGNLRFDGAPGNPALDIRAMRRGLEVEPGVAIGGSALAPRVMLVSEPQVPDTEKLSWLVLGQGLTAAGSTEMGALQSAAASLLSQGAAASMQSQLAGAFGVDTITLSQSRDNLQQRIITVGKRVSSRLMISYQQGLQSAGNAVVFRYTLSPRLSVEAETGTRSVFSLFYNFAFD
jgi:translocation and assembly module TamB